MRVYGILTASTDHLVENKKNSSSNTNLTILGVRKLLRLDGAVTIGMVTPILATALGLGVQDLRSLDLFRHAQRSLAEVDRQEKFEVETERVRRKSPRKRREFKLGFKTEGHSVLRSRHRIRHWRAPRQRIRNVGGMVVNRQVFTCQPWIAKRGKRKKMQDSNPGESFSFDRLHKQTFLPSPFVPNDETKDRVSIRVHALARVISPSNPDICES